MSAWSCPVTGAASMVTVPGLSSLTHQRGRAWTWWCGAPREVGGGGQAEHDAAGAGERQRGRVAEADGVHVRVAAERGGGEPGRLVPRVVAVLGEREDQAAQRPGGGGPPPAVGAERVGDRLGGLDSCRDQLRGAGHQPVQEDPYLLQDGAAQHAVDDMVPVVGDGALEEVVELGADVGDGPALRPVADDGPQVGADLPEDGWLLRQRRFPAEQGQEHGQLLVGDRAPCREARTGGP